MVILIRIEMRMRMFTTIRMGRGFIGVVGPDENFNGNGMHVRMGIDIKLKLRIEIWIETEQRMGIAIEAHEGI